MEENPNEKNLKTDYTKLVDVDPTKIHIEKNPTTVIANFFKFLKKTLSIKEGNILYGKVIKDTEEAVEFAGWTISDHDTEAAEDFCAAGEPVWKFYIELNEETKE